MRKLLSLILLCLTFGFFSQAQEVQVKSGIPTKKDTVNRVPISCDLFFNPATQLLKVDWPGGPDRARYEILNDTGQLIKKGVWKRGQPIRMTKLPDGYYRVRLIDGNQVFSKVIANACI